MARPRKSSRPRPRWCGHCDRSTRQVDLPNNTVARCPRCHELALEHQRGAPVDLPDVRPQRASLDVRRLAVTSNVSSAPVGIALTMPGTLWVAAKLTDPHSRLLTAAAEQPGALIAVNRRACRLSLQWAHAAVRTLGPPVEVDELTTPALLPELVAVLRQAAAL